MRTVMPLQCIYEGVPLDVVRISDQFGRAWVEHTYPGRDGADLEDMGRQPSRFEVECVFNGPAWLTILTGLKAVISAPTLTFAVFVHPYWGTLFGSANNLQVTHTDGKEDFARATFTFIEGEVIAFAFSVTANTASAAAAAAAASAAAAAAAASLAA